MLRPAQVEPSLATGLWENPDWRPASGGTFAVVVGISRYDHLPGAQPRRSETFGLGQLYVSALTGYRFFTWLRDRYRFDESPLAKCWVLLAPTEEELAAEPGLGQMTVRPTFDACVAAVLEWVQTMSTLADPASSRSMFFFSGHGLELYNDGQLLLPCDYLNTPVGGLNRALSTSNLRAGMASLGIPIQLFFIDACRNAAQTLQGARVEGYRALDEFTTAWSNPDLVAPILYASASGAQAFQPTDVSTGSTLYGGALLEGLEAREGFQPICDGTSCSVMTTALQTFMSQRVTARLKDLGATVRQAIRMGGQAYDVAVTRLAGPPAAAQEPPPSPAATLNQAFDIRTSLEGQGGVYGFERLGDGLGLDPFGDPAVAELWASGRLRPVDGEGVDDTAAPRLHAVDRDGTRAFRIVFSLRDVVEDRWLELQAGATTLAALLPAGGHNTRYLLELSREGDDIDRLEAGLAAGNEGLLGRAAALWLRYRDGDLSGSTGAIGPDLLDKALDEQFPLVATIACLILLRGRSFPSLGYLEQLDQYFPAWPDGSVLLARRRLAEGSDPEHLTAAADALLQLRERGLPRTSEAFGYAVDMVRQLAAEGRLDERLREPLLLLHQRLDEALRYFHPGGAFTAFSGMAAAVAPALAQGTRDDL